MNNDNSHREKADINKFKTQPVERAEVKNDAVGFHGKAVERDSTLCLAKRLHNRFFLRRATTGSFRLFNVLSDNVKELDSFHTDTGRQRWEFFSVPEDSYALYVKFLETENPVFLRNAERLAV